MSKDTKDRCDWLLKKRKCVACLYGCFVGGLGACRRRPPSDDDKWPRVDPNSWCGEFVPLEGFFDNMPDATKTIPREARRRKARS